MERGRDETKGKEPMTKRGELGASSTSIIKQLGICGEQLGISGDFTEYQGPRHERSIFLTQLPPPVYPPEILSQHSLLDPWEHSEDLPIHSESQLQTKPNDAGLGEETRRSLLTTALNRGGDTCEDLMPINISPDDVASIIGQIPFWKARSTMVNQQRLFAAQVFELHRLIKVQKLMAESPDILFEEGAYLRNPLKTSAQKKVQLNHDVEPTPDIDKNEVVYEKTDIRIQSLEKAVEKTPVPSPQIDNMMKFSPFKNEVRMASNCSLIYVGSEQRVLPISPAFPSITAVNSNLIVPHFMIFPHNARSATQQDELDTSFDSSDDDYDSYSDDYDSDSDDYDSDSEDLSISTDKSPSSPDNDEVCDRETRRIMPLITPAFDSINKMDDLCNYQSICNLQNQNSPLAAKVIKSTQSMDIVVHAGMASTSTQAAQISSSTPIHSEVEQAAVSIFPKSPANTLGTPEQPSQDFKLLPGNA